eukprot:6821631-Prymnesium_polylepis.1
MHAGPSPMGLLEQSGLACMCPLVGHYLGEPDKVRDQRAASRELGRVAAAASAALAAAHRAPRARTRAHVTLSCHALVRREPVAEVDEPAGPSRLRTPSRPRHAVREPACLRPRIVCHGRRRACRAGY